MLGCGSARIPERSRSAGRVARRKPAGVSVAVERGRLISDDAPTKPEVLLADDSATIIELVRSSRAWPPLAPAATTLIASSSLCESSIQSTFMSALHLLSNSTTSVGRRDIVPLKTSLTDVLRPPVSRRDVAEACLAGWGRGDELL